MSVPIGLSVMALVAFAIVLGQSLLQRLVRSLSLPMRWPGSVLDLLGNSDFYASVAVYVFAIVLYLFVLRSLSLTQANVTIIIFMLLTTLAVETLQGNLPGLSQIAGVTLAIAGVLLLNHG